METETGVWKPEVGGKAWFITGHKVIEGMITEAGKFLGDSYQFEGNGLRSFIFTEFLYPTAEAALASIKVYDLDGKEVVVTRDSHAMMELGAAKMLDVYLEALDVVVQSFKDYRSGKLSKDDFDKFIDQSIQTSDDMAARTAAFLDFHNAAGRLSAMAAGNEDPADPSQRDETDGRHRDPNFKGAQYPVVADPREITTPTDKRNGDPC